MKSILSIFVSTLLLSLFCSPQSLLAQDQSYRDGLEYRKWRLTIFPPLSTNGIDAKNYTARYSINLLAGYHGGIDGLEIGGLVNYTKYYSAGFQIAGLANVTSGDMAGVNLAGLANYATEGISGIQIAGFGNFSRAQLEGIQLAGIVNGSQTSTSGIQFAGVGNVSQGDMEGIQVSSVFNYGGFDLSGLQISGAANIARSDVEGLQATGGFNLAEDDISGLQASGGANIALGDMEGLMATGGLNYAEGTASGLLISGGANYSRYQQGLMISGGANISRELSGLQFAGLLNYARKAEGVQIGLVNYAKDFTGASVGFISYYENGRKNFDIRYTDGGFTEVGFNLGTYRLYNLGIVGYNTLLDRNVYRVGIGVGLEKNISDSFPNVRNESLFVNQEFSVVHNFEQSWKKRTNLIFSYRYLLGKRFGSGFSMYAGPTYNIQVTRVDRAADYTWYSLWSPSWNGRQYRFWVGFTAGIRLFKQESLPPMEEGWDWDNDWDW